MKIKVSDNWLKACGMLKFSGVALTVIETRDFGARGKFYKVELENGRAWEVWEIRGVEIVPDAPQPTKQPTWIVIYREKDALNCETKYYGPFTGYIDAEDFLCTLPAAIECDCKFIQPLETPNL